MNNKIKVAINGFGRIGKIVTKEILENHPNIDLVAINGKSPEQVLQYLKFDTAHGKLKFDAWTEADNILIKKQEEIETIKIVHDRNPENLPWRELNIDVVMECTGVFKQYTGEKGADKHIKAGAKKVIISAPTSDEQIPMVVRGVNSRAGLDRLNSENLDIISNASCTTNCVSPILKVLNKELDIKNVAGLTVHSVTSSQNTVDAYSKKNPRIARAAAFNIIPTSTGAANAVEVVLPEFKDRISMSAMRVPVLTGSVVYLTINLNQDSTVEKVNEIIKKASQNEMSGIIEYSTDELVSSDIIGNSYSSIFDSKLTKLENNTLELVIWYDNEQGYSTRMVEMITDVIK